MVVAAPIDWVAWVPKLESDSDDGVFGLTEAEHSAGDIEVEHEVDEYACRFHEIAVLQFAFVPEFVEERRIDPDLRAEKCWP